MLDYGIIGNCKTCALISKQGSIDWMCFPTFASSSVFGAILDESKGGRFLLVPDRKCAITQRYLPDTAILETTFSCAKYSFRVLDFFPRYKKIVPGKKKGVFKQNILVRIIEPLTGVPAIKVVFDPKPDYARGSVQLIKGSNSILVEHSSGTLRLSTNISPESILNEEFVDIKGKQYLVFGSSVDSSYTVAHCMGLYSATKKYWGKWVSSLVLPKEHRDTIVRSAITLKLLTFGETGAILAAATTSIPEEIGSPRCWDYRFCWVRDAAFAAGALKKIGREFEAKKLMEFIINRTLTDDFIQIMYGINGETKLTEEELTHLDGFHGSRPVRVGNAAYYQIQNDVYGEIIDLMYQYFVYYEYENKMTLKYWRFLRYVVNQIRFMWCRKDSSIWEFRGLLRHYTFSKVMCFVGVDRAVKIAKHFNKMQYVQEWEALRDEIFEDIMLHGYNEEVKAFTMHYGGQELDASLLMMTYHEVLPPTDKRLISTVRAIAKDLLSGFKMQRYKSDDDFGKSSSAFIICTFWLIDALHYIGDVERARTIYEQMIAHANHVGLFSEDIDIKTNKLLGNFPQAYTHIALINSSLLLSEWAVSKKKIDRNGLSKRIH